MQIQCRWLQVFAFLDAGCPTGLFFRLDEGLQQEPRRLSQYSFDLERDKVSELRWYVICIESKQNKNQNTLFYLSIDIFSCMGIAFLGSDEKEGIDGSLFDIKFDFDRK